MTDRPDTEKHVAVLRQMLLACRDPECSRAMQASIAALEASPGVVVPVEPTREMLNAAVDVDRFKLGDISPLGFRISPQQLFERCYLAMLAAAPKASAPVEELAITTGPYEVECDILPADPVPPVAISPMHVRHIGGSALAYYRDNEMVRMIGFTSDWDFKDRDAFVGRFNEANDHARIVAGKDMEIAEWKRREAFAVSDLQRELRDEAIKLKAAEQHAEQRAEQAEALLREAMPFIGWTGKPDGLCDRIDALLAEREAGK